MMTFVTSQYILTTFWRGFQVSVSSGFGSRLSNGEFMSDHNGNSINYVSYRVWDRTTRWFHWINVICVLCLATLGIAILNSKSFGVSGEGKILLKTLHVYVGYVFATNLAWRLIWGFIGGQYSRWKNILPGSGFIKELRTCMSGFRKGDAPGYLGHHPMGRLMITLMMALMLTQAATGLLLAGTDLYKPPFGNAIAEWVTAGDQAKLAQLAPGSKDFVDEAAYKEMREFLKPFGRVQIYVFYSLMVMIFLHILGVIVTEIRERNGLVSAMFSGRKVLAKPPVDRSCEP